MTRRTMERLILFFLISTLLCDVKGSDSICIERNECKVNQERFVPNCYCDQKCYVYRDCCKEFYKTETKENKTYPTMQLSDSCTLLTNQKYLELERIGAFMVNKCNESACPTSGDLKTLIPVSNGNITYRNAECALCNNVTNFQTWDIAFTVGENFEKELILGQHKNSLTILNEVENVDFAGIYYLHPPVGVTPRFCSYDMFVRGSVVDEHLDYQNIYSCNGTLYKNKDECMEDGCCRVHKGKCVGYVLALFRKTGYYRSDGSLPFHLIIQFGKSEMDGTSSVQEKAISFSDVKGYVKIELKELEKGPMSFTDCVYGIMAYLSSTIYRLAPDANQYFKTLLHGNNYRVFYPFKSLMILPLPEYINLFEMRTQIQCEDKSGRVTAYGQIKTSGIYGNENLFQPNVERFWIKDAGRFQTTPSVSTEECSNMSLAVYRSNSWKIPVEVRCLDDVEISNKTIGVNQATCLHNHLFLKVSILCYVILLVSLD